MNEFKFWCHKVLPLVYDDSLSYYELLCKVINYLNHLNEDVQTLVSQLTDLKNYVDEYLDNLNIEQVVEEKLEEMIADGAFDDVFAGIKEDNEIANPVTAMQPIYAGDYVLDTTLHADALGSSYLTDELIPSAVVKIGAWYLCLNGCNTASHDSNYNGYGSYLFASESVDSVNYAKQQNLTRINIGHANSACYDGDKVYILPLYTYTGTYGSETRVDWKSIIAYEIVAVDSVPTLQNPVEIPYTLPTMIMGISYDHVRNKKYVYCYGGHIYEFNGSVFTKVCDFDAPGLSRFNQDFAVYDGIFYLSMPRGALMIGKVDTGEILSTKIVARSYNLRYYGELQGIEFDEYGHLYAMNFYKVSGTASTKGGWGVIDAMVTYIPTKYIEAEPTENLYSIANTTFRFNPVNFKSSNTEIKHPCLINMFAMKYPVSCVNVSTTYNVSFGILQFWQDTKLIVGNNLNVSQIDAVQGHVIISNKTTNDVTLVMTDKNARSATDNSLFIVRNTARLTFALADTDAEHRATLMINYNSDRGTYARINIGFDFPLIAIRTIPQTSNLSTMALGYLQATASATDASNGIYGKDGLYVGSHRLAMWVPPET